MHTLFALAGSPMTPETGIHEANTGLLAEDDGKLSRTLDRPATRASRRDSEAGHCGSGCVARC